MTYFQTNSRELAAHSVISTAIPAHSCQMLAGRPLTLRFGASFNLMGQMRATSLFLLEHTLMFQYLLKSYALPKYESLWSVHVSPGGKGERFRPPWSWHDSSCVLNWVPCKHSHLQPQVPILNCQHKYAKMPE